VIRCLQNQRDKLTTNCRVTLFDEEIRFSENIDFQYPMKKVCAQEVEMFCKDVPHGNGRVIRCLQVGGWVVRRLVGSRARAGVC
jgi:Golgi apparatus protein 1